MERFLYYLGGKAAIAKQVISFFPEHHCYIDVFGGAGNILINKTPSPVEVFNDINQDVVNLFEQIRDNGDELYRKLKSIPNSRKVYDNFLKKFFGEETNNEFDRAVMYYTILNQGTMSHETKWSSSPRGTPQFFMRKVEIVPQVIERLRGVYIENESFEFILKKYDTKESLFYLDPPYLSETRETDIYKHEMSLSDHEELINMLKEIKGKVVLSGYENELYNSLQWNKEIIESKSSMAQMFSKQEDKTRSDRKQEVIWYNFEENYVQNRLF